MTRHEATSINNEVDTDRKARTRSLALGIATGLGSRLLTLAAPLLTIPVTLRYLGEDLFGFWMIVSSVTAMAMFADLGLGNGLLTQLSASAGARNIARAKSLISTAYVTLGGVSLLLLAATWIVIPLVDWARVLEASDGLDPGAVQLVSGLCLSAFAITIPLSLVQRVQYAFRDAWKSNVWQVAGAAVTVAAVYATAFLNLGYGIIIAAAVFSGPLVILVNNIVYYTCEHRELRPAFADATSRKAASLLRVGLAFFFLSILTSVSLNVDNIIVANVSDLRTVTEFSVTTKLFSLLSLAVTLIALPLWPANGEALARGDTVWVKRTTKLMVMLSVGAVAVSGIVLVAARDNIASLWLGAGHTISLPLATGLAFWSTTVAIASPLFSVQNSVGLLRYQFVGWTLFALLSVPLKLISYSLFGLPGIPIAGVFAYAILLIPAAVLGYKATLLKVVDIGRF